MQNATADSSSLLDIRNLTVQFRTVEGIHQAVRDVSISMKPAETLCIVGESGSGKTVLALSIMGLVPNPPGEVTAGSILFEGNDLLRLTPEEIRKIRGKDISMIFQEPMTSLNPIHTCGRQIMEPLMLHQGCSRHQAREMALDLLKLVGIPLPSQRLNEYPHQLSGGMRQRAMIAMALACRPRLLLADEPTTALDVTIQAQILELMKELREQVDSGIIMITHDMGVVSEMCDRVVVMYAGQVVESSPVRALYKQPLHPYSEGLLKSIPIIKKEKRRLYAIEGTVPNPFTMPTGCSFEPRCRYSEAVCSQRCPNLLSVSEDHAVRCWRYASDSDRQAAGG